MKRIKEFLKKLFKPVSLVIKELKMVEWISLKQTVQYTLLVLVISLFVGIIIVAFDTVFFKARNFILDL